MPKRSAPDPRISIAAVRVAAQRAACLYAKGIGECVILQEAADIFDRLCPDLPRPLARYGRDLAKAAAKARKPIPMREPRSGARPPSTLMVALSRPLRPGEERDVSPAGLGQPASEKVPPAARPQGGKPAGNEYARGHLRLIPGGRPAAGQG